MNSAVAPGGRTLPAYCGVRLGRLKAVPPAFSCSRLLPKLCTNEPPIDEIAVVLLKMVVSDTATRAKLPVESIAVTLFEMVELFTLTFTSEPPIGVLTTRPALLPEIVVPLIVTIVSATDGLLVVSTRMPWRALFSIREFTISTRAPPELPVGWIRMPPPFPAPPLLWINVLLTKSREVPLGWNAIPKPLPAAVLSEFWR